MDSKRLLGYTFALSTGKETRNRDELLTLRVETSLLCNMKCKYCAWNSGYALEDEINFDTLKRFIAEGKDMGIQSAVIIGGGEPTIYKHFKELVEYIVELELIPVVITNGLTMDHTLASFLFNKKCSVLLKCDSLCKHTQDFLSGIEGAYEKIQSGLKDLLDCGFAVSTNNELRMGISFVVTSKNIDEIPDIWRYCRKNNLFPNMELLNPIGRSADNLSELLVDNQKFSDVLRVIREIDNIEFGIHQNDYEFHSNHCLQHIYSVYLNVLGYVQPCGAIRIQKYNYNDSSLKEIMNTEYYRRIRHIEKHLDESVELTSYEV